MKITLRELRQLINEEGNVIKDKRVLGASLDNQLDRYFSEYEQEAHKAKNETHDWFGYCRQLLEGDMPTQSKQDETLDEFDVENFANSIANMIENYENLLEFHDTIVNRAKNFLTKSYNKSIVTSFEDALREQHGLVVGKSQEDVEDSEYASPNSGIGGGPELTSAAG
jgi:phage shock protein A